MAMDRRYYRSVTDTGSTAYIDIFLWRSFWNSAMIGPTLRQVCRYNARRKALEEALVLLQKLSDHLVEADKDFGNVTNAFDFAREDLGNSRQGLEEELKDLDWEDVA